MGLFGKPPGGANGATPQTGHGAKADSSALKTGKSKATPNSVKGGKAFGSPTTMGVSGLGYEPSGGAEDRWSYGNASTESTHSHEETWSPRERSGWGDERDKGGSGW